MSLNVPLLVLGLLTAARAELSRPEAAIPVCPAVSPGHVAYVRQFFAAPESESFRERHGLLSIRPGDIRPLTDRDDAEACRRISGAVTLPRNGHAPKVWSWYQAGDHYIVVVANENTGGAPRHGGGTGLIVLDANMRIHAAAS